MLYFYKCEYMSQKCLSPKIFNMLECPQLGDHLPLVRIAHMVHFQGLMSIFVLITSMAYFAMLITVATFVPILAM